MALREVIRQVLSTLLMYRCRFLHNRGYGLSGDYQSWDEAMLASTSYAQDIILEKTKVALLQVKSGKAAYERDSVVFNEIQYAWPLLAGLMWIAAQTDGRLNVLDFGGSLGSTFFQNRIFLRSLHEVRWNIIEQPEHVKTGKEWFENDHVRFYLSVEECLAETQPSVVLLSGVLQYLERPYNILCELLKLPFDHIIIDRTPFWDGPTDRLCVQRVPPDIYQASYPSWIFSTERFCGQLSEEWKVFVDFESLDRLRSPIKAKWKGMIMVREKQHIDGRS